MVDRRDVAVHGGPDDPRSITEYWDAIDDLWASIGKAEIEHLQPETVELAQEVHERLWHHPHHVFKAQEVHERLWHHPHHVFKERSPRG